MADDEKGASPTRLNTIVDGVFAIAMTLLVLDLPRPLLSGQVVHDLEVHWDSYIAYLVSFATLGVVWLEHHGMMIAVRRTSRRFIELTFVFLLFVAVLPWPTALTAQFADEARTAKLVTVMYSSTMFFIALTMAGAWAYLSRNERMLSFDLKDSFRAALPRTAAVCGPYLLAILVAFFNPLSSLVIDAAVVVYLALSRSPLERVEAGVRLEE
jgi:uncharacterized membrane protein